MKATWILGAPDPEMEAIETLLRECGERVIYALAADGQRVHPGAAYRAAALSAPVPDGATVYAVECGGPAVPAGAVATDHHRPGDPGYGRPPEEFMQASSLGQVIYLLVYNGLLKEGWDKVGWRIVESEQPNSHEVAICIYAQESDRTVHTANYVARYENWTEELENEITRFGAPFHDNGLGNIAIGNDRRWYVCTKDENSGQEWMVIPQNLIFAAAADHCLAAAYRGECPGVDPDALMRWRAESRAAFQGRAVEEVLRDVEAARRLLREAPVIVLGNGETARDMRAQNIPELPEAAAREGVCFLASVSERPGREKIVCQAGTPEQIRAFMEVWAPANGITGIYGDPARGFAGGYTPA